MTLEQLGWNAEWAAAHAALAPARTPARVARQDRDSYIVYTAGRALRASVSGAFRHRASGPADFPAVGDWVTLNDHPLAGARSAKADPHAAAPFSSPDALAGAPSSYRDAAGAGVIHAILPRRSCITRRAAGDATVAQALAANVDLLLICCGLDDDFNLRRIERYLSLAYGCGVTPLIVLTKADLCPSADRRALAAQDLAPDAAVVVASAADGRGIDAVRSWLPPGQTAVLAGSSGVGKSTLINCLLGREEMKTNAVRTHDNRGKHTTTHRQLLLLPGGGVLIDSPGMRELQLWDGAADVGAAFGQIATFSHDCRFRDCTHAHEPGCGVRAAVERGELPAERLASYHKQQRELRSLEIREDPALRSAETARWKAIHKSARKWIKRKYGQE